MYMYMRVYHETNNSECLVILKKNYESQFSVSPSLGNKIICLSTQQVAQSQVSQVCLHVHVHLYIYNVYKETKPTLEASPACMCFSCAACSLYI